MLTRERAVLNGVFAGQGISRGLTTVTGTCCEGSGGREFAGRRGCTGERKHARHAPGTRCSTGRTSRFARIHTSEFRYSVRLLSGLLGPILELITNRRAKSVINSASPSHFRCEYCFSREGNRRPATRTAACRKFMPVPCLFLGNVPRGRRIRDRSGGPFRGPWSGARTAVAGR